MAAASSLRNGAFLLARQRMARGWERRMCMSRNGSGAGNAGGGGGPANGGAANSGGARVNGSGGGGGPANGGAANSGGARVNGSGGGGGPANGGATNSGGARVNGSGSAATGGSGGATGGGGGAATNGASNSGGRGTAGGAVANSGGGGAANSGSGGGATGLALLREDACVETNRLLHDYNKLEDVDKTLLQEIARLEADNVKSRVGAKADEFCTSFLMLGFGAASFVVISSWLGKYMKASVVNDAAKEVEEIRRLRKFDALMNARGGKGADKTAAASINVDAK